MGKGLKWAVAQAVISLAGACLNLILAVEGAHGNALFALVTILLMARFIYWGMRADAINRAASPAEGEQGR
jgi:O-antigen/teichoic acid export membrane protein